MLAATVVLGCASDSEPETGEGSPSNTSAGAEADADASSDSTPDPDEGGDPSTSGEVPGTSSTTDAPGDSSGDPVDEEPGPDLREPGPVPFDTTPGQADLGPGCTMTYDWVRPTVDAPEVVVILAHGMQGNRGSMVGWAEHWASWGLSVISVNLCHATIGDADHGQNGTELVALAESLGIDQVIYAGHSAGGLATFIAGSRANSRAVAVLGLDMVDAGGLGGQAVPSMTVPAYNLAGESTTCNASSNGSMLYKATGGRALKLVDSDHCDFQNPADGFCMLCYTNNATFDPADIQKAVYALSTGYLMWQSGVDSRGKQWWTPGAAHYESLLSAGFIAEL